MGRLEELREDRRGGRYAAELFDGVPPLILDGLRGGEYGSSFRFKVITEEFVQRPGRSKRNPEGIPERTIAEARLFEIGPTPFPAYARATAGERSGQTIPAIGDGRQEIGARGHGVGATPLSIRKLQAAAKRSSRAAELVRALERGGRVELVWNEPGVFERGRVLRAGPVSERLYGDTSLPGRPFKPLGARDYPGWAL